jgi:hypothetical protein
LPGAIWYSPGDRIEFLGPLRAKNLAVVKIHSHPTGVDAFSSADDVSDEDLFPSVHEWIGGSAPLASVAMLHSGRMFGRLIGETGDFSPLSRIAVVGDDIRMYSHTSDRRLTADCILHSARREAPLFGAEMTGDLGRFSVAVVGCSGLGSIVAELLARHGFGRIILIDPEPHRASESITPVFLGAPNTC